MSTHARTHGRTGNPIICFIWLPLIHEIKFTMKIFARFALKSCLNPTPHSWTEVNSSDRFSVPIYRFCFFSPAQKRKLSSPRINFPIYPLFITSFIKRDSYVLVFLLPHRLKKRYIGKQLPRTLGEICFFSFFHSFFGLLVPVSMAIQNICEKQMWYCTGNGKCSTLTDHQHAARNELFAFQYTIQCEQCTPVHTFTFIKLSKIGTLNTQHLQFDLQFLNSKPLLVLFILDQIR